MSQYPYPGLRPFQRDEDDVFFGRDEQIDQVLLKLGSSRFLSVVGPSGCGKSSLIRAGLIPGLESGLLSSLGARWKVAEMRPGDRPMTRLAEALIASEVLGRKQDALPTALLRARLGRGPLGLVEALDDAPSTTRGKLLVLIDQFEEIFRYRRRAITDEDEAFVELLLASAQRDVLVYVVLTMRSDFLGDCARFRGLPEAMNDSQFLTPRLTRDQQREAIVGPAAVYGSVVEPALVNRLLNDMGPDPDQLPLMQHVLMRMWMSVTRRSQEHTDTDRFLQEELAEISRRAGDSALGGLAGSDGFHITVDEYKDVGGLANALSAHADKVYGELTPDQQRIAETMFRLLSERGSDQRETRHPTRLDMVARVADVDVERVIPVVDAFRWPGRAFVTLSQDPPPKAETILDIAHESLIRRWKKMDEWVEEESGSAETYRRLEDRARLWRAKEAGVWRRPELDLAIAWREDQKPSPQWAQRYGSDFELAMEFLHASEEKREEDRRDRRRRESEKQEIERAKQEAQVQRRTNIFLGSLTTLLFIAAITAFFQTATVKRQREFMKSILEERRLAEQASSEPLRTDRLLLAVEAQKAGPKDGQEPTARRGERVLHRVLSTEWKTTALRGRAPPKTLDMVFSPNNRWLVELDETGISLWDTDHLDGEPVELPGAKGLAFSSDGRWLATWGIGAARVWRTDAIAETAQVLAPSAPTATFESLAFLPRETQTEVAEGVSEDSSEWWLATGDRAGFVSLWKASGEDGAFEKRCAGSQRKDEVVGALAFSHNGSLLVSASWDGTVKTWDTSSAVICQTNGELSPVSETRVLEDEEEVELGALIFSPDDVWLAGRASNARSVYVWRTVKWPDDDSLWGLSAEPQRLSFTEGFATKLAFIPEPKESEALDEAWGSKPAPRGGRWLAAQEDGKRTTELWDLRVLEKGDTRKIELAHSSDIAGMTVSSDGRWLAVGTPDGAVLWHVDSDDPYLATTLRHDGDVNALSFSPDSRKLATADKTGSVRVTTLMSPVTAEPLVETELALNLLAIDRESRRLVAANAAAARVWDLAEKDGPLELRQAENERINRMAMTTDGRFVALSSSSSSSDWRKSQTTYNVKVWDLGLSGRSREEPILEVSLEKKVNQLSFSSNGKQLAAASGKEVRIWSLETLETQPRHVLEHEEDVLSMLFRTSPDRASTELYTGIEGEYLYQWNPDSGDKIEQIELCEPGNTQIKALAASSDGRALAAACGGVVSLRRTGMDSKKLRKGAVVLELAFSPKGRWLAVQTEKESVILWDLKSALETPHELRHHARVETLAFDPEERWLVTASKENLRFWSLLGDPAKDSLLLPRPGSTKALVFAPASNALITSDPKAHILEWDLDSESLRDTACRVAGTEWPPQKWEQFFPDRKQRKTCAEIDTP